MSRISSKHQVTLPVDTLQRAGLRAGDEVTIDAEGPDQIVVRRASTDRTEAFGVFDAETLVRPAEHERTLRTATDAIAALGVRLIAPTPAIARGAAQHRALSVSLGDGFAMATAQAHDASLASLDRRVRRALPKVGLSLTAGF